MMEQLLQQILLALEQAGVGENCRLVAAFPPSKLPHPLSRACVAVGFRNLTVSDGALGRYWGKLSNTAVNAGRLKAVLLLRIYAPRAWGGGACYQILEQIQRALEQEGTFAGCPMQAGEVTSDRNSDAFLLEAEISVTRVEAGEPWN